MQGFDINCAIGHFPFRRLPFGTLPELAQMHAAVGIRGGAVSNINSACYRDAHEGNRELDAALREFGSPDYVGIGTVNPVYPDWERDFGECVERFGFKAVRLLPRYHGYDWAEPALEQFFAMAAAAGLPVMVPCRLEDCRHRALLDVTTEMTLAELNAVAAKHPEVKFIAAEYYIFERDAVHAPANIYYEFSRILEDFYPIESLRDTVGSRRLLLGTGLPFKNPQVSVTKLLNASWAPDEMAAVAAGNASGLLHRPA